MGIEERGIIVGVDTIGINEGILKETMDLTQTENQNQDEEKIREYIRNNNHNHFTAVYYLLLKQSLEDSPSDSKNSKSRKNKCQSMNPPSRISAFLNNTVQEIKAQIVESPVRTSFQRTSLQTGQKSSQD